MTATMSTLTVERVADAKATADRLYQEEQTIARDLERLARELTAARESAGVAVLAYRRGGADAKPAISRVAELEAEIEATRASQALVQSEHLDAKEAVWEAQAQHARDQAAGLQAEIDQIEAEAAPLLERLRQINGSGYMPTWQFQQVVNQFALIHTDREPMPRTVALKNQIEQLTQQAAIYDQRVMEHRRGRS